MAEEEISPRRRKLLGLRGIRYGVSAFGFQLGAIPGVQMPYTDPPLGEQWGGDAGVTGDSGSSDAGTTGGGDSSGGTT